MQGSGKTKMGGSVFSVVWHLSDTLSLIMSFNGEVFEEINMAPYSCIAIAVSQGRVKP